MAAEGAAKGVLTNLLLPYAQTRMTEAQMTDDGMPSSARKHLEPDAVAPVLTALASQDCRLNGEYIVTGGGRLRRASVVEWGTVPLPNDPDLSPGQLETLLAQSQARQAERVPSLGRGVQRPDGRRASVSWGPLLVNLAVTAGTVAVLMLATFGYAMRTRVHAIMDTVWPLGFVIIAAVSFGLSAGDGDTGRRVLVLLLTAVWGLRQEAAREAYGALQGHGVRRLRRPHQRLHPLAPEMMLAR